MVCGRGLGMMEKEVAHTLVKAEKVKDSWVPITLKSLLEPSLAVSLVLDNYRYA